MLEINGGIVASRGALACVFHAGFHRWPVTGVCAGAGADRPRIQRQLSSPGTTMDRRPRRWPSASPSTSLAGDVDVVREQQRQRHVHQPLGTFTPFILDSTNLRIIAPFFADVDTGATARAGTVHIRPGHRQRPAGIRRQLAECRLLPERSRDAYEPEQLSADPDRSVGYRRGQLRLLVQLRPDSMGDRRRERRRRERPRGLLGPRRLFERAGRLLRADRVGPERGAARLESVGTGPQPIEQRRERTLRLRSAQR